MVQSSIFKFSRFHKFFKTLIDKHADCGFDLKINEISFCNAPEIGTKKNLKNV